MNEDLLQDLVLYKKSHEKAISAAARSLISLFREVYFLFLFLQCFIITLSEGVSLICCFDISQLCPSMLVKKDRGRPSDPTARPKAYGEVSVASAVPGVELLQNNEDDEDDDSIGSDEEDIDAEDSDDGGSVGIDNSVSCGSDDENATSDDEETHASTDDNECGDESLEGDSVHGEDSSSAEDLDEVSSDEVDEDEDEDYDEDAKADCGDDNEEVHDEVNAVSETNSGEEKTGSRAKISETRKRKFTDFDGQINAAETSLRALKKLAETKLSQPPSDSADGILSNEDFQRIKQLKVLKFAYDVSLHQLISKRYVSLFLNMVRSIGFENI